MENSQTTFIRLADEAFLSLGSEQLAYVNTAVRLN